MTTTPATPSQAVGLAEVREQALGLLDQYAETDGLSPSDDYDAQPRVHPMAEAKYILACIELIETGALGPSIGLRRIRDGLGRLESTDVGAGTDKAAWGLGFAYRDLPEDEPFTITTAIVLNALTRMRPHVTDEVLARCEALHDRASAWLLDGVGRIEDDGAWLPAYSPGLPLAAYNVAAYWAASLSQALPADDPRHADVERVAAAVLDRYIPGVGWPYDPNSSRVDLVHVCYIAWGLLTALPDRRGEVEQAALCALLQFSGQTWSDWFDVRDLAETFAREGPRGGRVTRVAGGMALVGFDKLARPWSVGEALVLLGTLTQQERVAPFCYRELRALASSVVTEYLPESRYRHSMHIAHGLSIVVRTARERNRTSPS